MKVGSRIVANMSDYGDFDEFSIRYIVFAAWVCAAIAWAIFVIFDAPLFFWGYLLFRANAHIVGGYVMAQRMSDFGTGVDVSEFSLNDPGRVLKIFFWIFIGVSSLTTYRFFAEYASESLGRGFGLWSGVLAGVVGVLLLDVGSLVWLSAVKNSKTPYQYVAAGIAAFLTLFGALSTSVVYTYLTIGQEFDAGLVDAAGNLTRAGQLINGLGLGTMIAATVVNFAAAFAWQLASPANIAGFYGAQQRGAVFATNVEVDRNLTQQALAAGRQAALVSGGQAIRTGAAPRVGQHYSQLFNPPTPPAGDEVDGELVSLDDNAPAVEVTMRPRPARPAPPPRNGRVDARTPHAGN